MATTVSDPDYDPLKHFNIDKDASLIDDLVIAMIFGKESNESIAKALAVRNPDYCTNVLPSDVANIFNFLAANSTYDNNTYKKWMEVQAVSEFADEEDEVQQSLREWVIDIERAGEYTDG